MSLNFIIYPREGIVTGRKLKAELGIRGGVTYPIRLPSPDMLIRFGSRRLTPTPAQEYQRLSALRAISSKLWELKKLREGGVKVPDHWLVPPPNLQVLGRSFSGMGGRGIVTYGAGCTLGKHDFYTGFIEKKREFRVHVFGGKVYKTQEKVGGSKRGTVWNFRSGFRFLYPRGVPKWVRTEARRAVDALNLDFGAVDIITDKDDVPYVLEVNTAPGLCDASLHLYVKRFGEVLV